MSFSFDVGTERMELSVHSALPLNDDRWHRVEAQKNVKEAVLHLDGQQREVRLAPSRGHAKPDLDSDVYLGKEHGREREKKR